jgi:hypothetical protein
MSNEADMGDSQKVLGRPVQKDSEGTAEMSVITSHGVGTAARQRNGRAWCLNRQVSVSVLVQLVFLASLIVGSWVNLQRQLDLLQHDVTLLLRCQENFEQKLESLSAKSISYEYRLRGIEKHILKADHSEKCLLP